MIVATLREENKPYNVYAVDPYRERFLVDYNGKFKWFAISDFIPFNMFCDLEEKQNVLE